MTSLTHENVESILALQAIGVATPEEERSAQEHLATCSQCGEASDEYLEAASTFATALEPVMPPPGTRERVLSTVTGSQSAPINIEEGRARISPWWLATAATLFLALWGWREFGIRVARERLQSQQAEISRLSEENARLAQRTERLSREVSTLAAAETRTIILAGQQVSPTASARAFLQPQEGRAVVFFHGLPANPTDKSYQLWILRGAETQPESAGVFDAPSGRASLVIDPVRQPDQIKGLAVTLEPRGGVPQPTNTTFYLVGQT